MESLTRRALLKAAGLGLLGSTFARSAQAAPGNERALLVIWLEGGASQLETWDPHQGSTTQSLPTSIAGYRVADFLPRMAERMENLSVVRSLVCPEGDHRRATYAVKTGYRMDPTVAHPTLGALLAHERPVKELQLPAYIALGGQEWAMKGGYLGPKFDAFRVHDVTKRAGNLHTSVDDVRMKRRLASLRIADEAFARRAEASMHEAATANALAMMRSSQVAAFDIAEEPQGVLERYGLPAQGPIFKDIGGSDRFSASCLVARRLLERGVRSVEVSLGGFDSHINNHETHAELCPQLDRGFAALLDDLVERDMLRKTVVVCMTEFGRTPTINPLNGRDHWPRGFSGIVGGAGLRRGQVIGETDPQGLGAPKRPISIQDLGATLLSALGLDPTDELDTPAGRPMPFSRGSVIKELIL